MTTQIAAVFLLLILAAALFITERVRVDVVALLVLSALALTGLVTPAEAVSGFSNPAVITVWAVFILSGGLSRTGVASVIGGRVLKLAGQAEVRLLIVIMVTAGVLSAFMNNVGVAALLLPVVMEIARRTGHPPSKLLMPLAFGSLLGGLNTLIGTPPNILISDALNDYGLRPFHLFDFTPVGLAVTLSGIVFMALVGRHLLPSRDLTRETTKPGQPRLAQIYDFRQRLSVIHVPATSALVGKTLVDSRLGAVLDLNVIGIVAHQRTELSPPPNTLISAGDKLLVTGRPDRMLQLQAQQQLIIEPCGLSPNNLLSAEIGLAELSLSPRSTLVGQTLQEIDFRRRFHLNVLAIWRDGQPRRTHLNDLPLQAEDTVLVQGPRVQFDALRESPDFLVSSAEVAEVYRLHERLLAVRISPDSTLVDQTLASSRLSEVFGLTVLGIVRAGTLQLAPEPTTQLDAGDTLLVEGKPEDVSTLRELQQLEIDQVAAMALSDLESDQVGLAEAVLSPHNTLVGQTCRDIHFREKYGLNVLAIWRKGRVFRSNLASMALQFGDALLLHGPREKIKLLGSEPDFVVLAEAAQEAPRLNKAPLAAFLMVGVILPAIFGWLPIYIAAVVGATLMVVSGCLTMEEAYRFIEWKAVFLIAGMLPLGIAMESSGAAAYLAEGMIAMIGGLGPTAILIGLFVLTSLATQVMPNPAVAVLLAPIAVTTAARLGLSPYALMMTVAIAASASFLSPVAHPANVLIMGPGGYRFGDYLKVGVPLSLVVLGVVLLVLPFFWPLQA